MFRFSFHFYIRVIAALALGLIFAAMFTLIQYPCVSNIASEGCISFEKAVMHPVDLLHNKQNTAINFIEIFAGSSLIIFALSNTYAFYNRKNQP